MASLPVFTHLLITLGDCAGSRAAGADFLDERGQRAALVAGQDLTA